MYYFCSKPPSMKKLMSSFIALLLAGPFLTAQSSRTFPEENASDAAIIRAARDLSAGASTVEDVLKLDKALEKDPDNDALHYYLARCYFLTNPTEAEKHLVEAVRLDPENPTYLETLANFYSASGNGAKSGELLVKLLEKYPEKYSNERTLTALADSQLAQMKDTLALENFDKALLFDPTYIPAILGRSEVFRMRGNMPAFFVALEPFTSDETIAPAPKCEYVNQILSRVNGRFFRAYGPQLDSMVTSCVKAHPTDSSTFLLAGRWFYATDRKELGESYFDRLLENYPEMLEAHYIRIQLLGAKNDDAGIISECETIYGLCASNPKEQVRVLSIMGDTYHSMGDVRMCYKTYDRALKIDPLYVPILNNYAYFLCLEKRKLAKAEKMSRVTVEAEPENATYLDTLGWILHLRGRDAEAKPLFKKAMAHGGKDSGEVLRHYSEVLSALGEKDLATYYKGLADNKK